MSGLEMFARVGMIIGACFICIAAFCNILDDWSLYSGYQKRRIILLIRNIFVFILAAGFTTIFILCSVSDTRHPENQVKTLKMRVDNAQERLDRYLEKHPEFKEEINESDTVY